MGEINMELLLGIDFGTGGCKLTLTDGGGRILDSASGEYPSSHPHPGWAEQSPDHWFAVMLEGLKTLRSRPAWSSGRIIGVGLDSYTHGAVLLDKDMRVIRPTIIWTDQRSAAESRELSERHGVEIFAIGGQMPTPTWTLPQLLWLKRNEPENFSRITHISFVKDYVRYLLTGELAVDHIEAEGSLLYDVRQRRWSPELCAMAGIDMETLPQLREVLERGGKVTSQAAELCGIPAGTPVVMGASDSAIEDYAAGAIEPGQGIIKLATAGNVNVMTGPAHYHERTLTYSHVVPGMHYTVTATNAAAICQRWFRDLCCDGEKSQAKESGRHVYDILDDLAAASNPGAGGVMFHPYLSGERSPYWDPALRGSFTGLSMGTSKGDMARGLLEGVAFSLRDCFRTIEEMGLPVREFILIGGGAKSALWGQIVSDVFNLPLKVPSGTDASFGSALLAGVGAGMFPGVREAVLKCVRTERELTPDPERAEFYAGRFGLYRQVHDALAAVYHKF